MTWIIYRLTSKSCRCYYVNQLRIWRFHGVILISNFENGMIRLSVMAHFVPGPGDLDLWPFDLNNI